jgi:hypothetical protein
VLSLEVPYSGRGGHAIEHRHQQVHQDEVEPGATGPGDSFGAIGGEDRDDVPQGKQRKCPSQIDGVAICD